VDCIYVIFVTFLPPVTLTFDLFKLKIGTPLSPALGNVCMLLLFLRLFVSMVGTLTEQTDGQADRRKDRQDA